MKELKQFCQAIQNGDRDAVEKMLMSDPKLAAAFDDDGATPLHHAAFHGHREIAELLLTAGAELNARDRMHGATPAGWAIHYLRERGGLLAIEIEDVLFAIERGDIAWLDRLMTRHPALAHAVDRNGKRLAAYATPGSEIERVFERCINQR
ncbi:MAG TPA: ankyrin repeat domain-containing protein [Gemmatimonadaceae bacterium]|nr:ankyrin repeat domain-containing protein [Gemmatimonadaceae bacterium]